VAEVCICYTGNILTSKVYNLAYYSDLAKRIANSGAHIIAIKDMAGLLKPFESGPLLKAIRDVTDLPVHFHTHATSSGSIATCMEMARNGCEIIDFCTASMADGTSQPSLNAFVAMMEDAPNATGMNFMDLEPYDMYWGRVRDIYSPFESGMKSGSARVFEHQIPGGQYSNLFAQCKSMDLFDRWEEVLDAYRDVNEVFGDIVKVTPSSKCVGDLALYLVTKNVKAADLMDPEKAQKIDFPVSVVGLMKGDLGFPHRGFPAAIENAILKGQVKRTERSGLTLAPEDFTANIAKLSEKWGRPISREEGMSSLMYPQVFDNFMKAKAEKGGILIRHLPSPVYLYGMTPGSSFWMSIPPDTLEELGCNLDEAEFEGPGGISVQIVLVRVCPLKDRHRNVIFTVNGQELHVVVKDNSGAFVFEGAMADAKNDKHLASPMPGVIEKVIPAAGDSVKAGDTLMIVSAMKMEVKVTAPRDGVIDVIETPTGTRVVEGALLLKLK
jgi:pyruvate carboxylase